MRRLALAAVVVFALALPAPSIALAPKIGCHPKGSKTLVANSQARVFKLRGWVYGCLRSTRRRTILVWYTGYAGWEQLHVRPQLAGRFVAFAYYWEGAVEGAGYGIRIVDLRKRTQREIALENTEDVDYVLGDFKVHRIVVTRAGSLAFSWNVEAKDADGRDTSAREVRKLEPGDPLTKAPPYNEPLGVLLDSGPELDLNSLTLTGSTLSWLKAGEPVTAPLP